MTKKELLKKITPHFLLNFYHYLWPLLSAIRFGFPSRKLIVIGVTGTSGKSTTVDFITKILEESGNKVVSNSSIRFKVAEKEWPNTYKMSMPGRSFMQKLLAQGVKAGCNYAVLEITSEGIKQFRHKFINFDTAVFTNLTPEHIESHGGFENYRNEKLKLFYAAKNVHVVNIDDKNSSHFWQVPAKTLITFSREQGDVNLLNTTFELNLLGDFNQYNALAAIAVARHYGVPLETCQKALKKIQSMPGRMEVVQKDPFLVVVDYAHTPEQLEQAYQSLKGKPLVCVLGSCGGGRDKWKRPTLGQIAARYCKEVIVTNEDPYNEDPGEIIDQVAEGAGPKAKKILDRGEAIQKALKLTQKGGAVIITGKGSENLMCLADGKKIPWSDAETVRQALDNI